MPCAVSNRCSQTPSRPASKQHATSTARPSLVEARERSSAISASSAVVSPPSMRCSRDFSAPGRRAATSHDEKLSSMATRTVVSDGMVTGSRFGLRIPASLEHSAPAVSALIASETRPLSACRPRRARRSRRGSRRSFFERRQGLGILGMMPGPRRQLAQLEGTQFAAQRLLADRNAEFLEHPLRQVNQPPAHHPVNRRDRAALDDLQQRLAVRRGKQRRVARRLAVHQASRTLGVERQNPVPHCLQPNPADLRRLGPRPAVIDRRQRQQAPRLIGIVRPLRQLAQSRGLVIPSNPNRRSHGKPPRVCHGESHLPRFGNPPRESPSRGLGISPYPPGSLAPKPSLAGPGKARRALPLANSGSGLFQRDATPIIYLTPF